MFDRVILHVDLNNCFASIELLDKPELRSSPFAVCGSVDDRHGIILAKNEVAKAYGVKTAETLWQARQKCPGLVTVPPQHRKYAHYSRLALALYQNYTDCVEPFGIDECWLDVTGSVPLLGDGETLAQQIRLQIKQELGLTVSVGISFNKVFAKLGSDLKKPDAVTLISRQNFKKIIFPLPVEQMIGVGRVTAKKLHSFGIYTLGDLATADRFFLEQSLGKAGIKLAQAAAGEDLSPVVATGSAGGGGETASKSMGRGITCRENLLNEEEVGRIFIALSQELSDGLHRAGYRAGGLQIAIKDSDFRSRQVQTQLSRPSRSEQVLYREALGLFKAHYRWEKPVRALTITAIQLTDETNSGRQISFFDRRSVGAKEERLDETLYDLRRRFGADIVERASRKIDNKLPRQMKDK